MAAAPWGDTVRTIPLLPLTCSTYCSELAWVVVGFHLPWKYRLASWSEADSAPSAKAPLALDCKGLSGTIGGF